MTSQQPTYLSQGVHYLGFLAQQLGDLAGKTTLAHELIQNADDAKDDSGRLSATRITFDVTDTALLVSNDAVFRKIDFDRMRDVSSGSKRSEPGERTTGAFGVGFISVYQVTDRPEIHSAGLTWILRPDNPEDSRIEQRPDSSITVGNGTVFRFPWALEDSGVRRALKAPTVSTVYIESFVDELEESLPIAILFLKKLERIELLHNGEFVGVVTRKVNDDTIQVFQDGDVRCWRVLEASFSDEAMKLKARYSGSIDRHRSDRVRVAVPDSLGDDGLLFATLPTEQSIGLPFHIDADFFPASDRKTIEFGDAHDPRSEWNRAAIRSAASALPPNLIPLRNMYSDTPSTLWGFLSRIQEVHQRSEGNDRLPLGEFWESLLPSLGEAPIVYTESGKWLVPKRTRIPTGPQEEDAVQAFQDIGIEIVHRDLWRNSRNLLMRREVGVRRVSSSDLYDRLKGRGYADGPISSPPVQSVPIDVLWRGVEGVLANEQGSSKETASRQLEACALAPGLDGRLWPSHSAFRSDKRTRELFAPLIRDDATFLAREATPLWQQLCPKFTVATAIATLASWNPSELEDRRQGGDYDPLAVLQWFATRRADLTVDQHEKFAKLPIFPSAKDLRPLEELWLPGGFEDTLGEANILDSKVPDSLYNFLRELGIRQLTFEDYAGHYIPKAFAKDSTLDKGAKRKLLATLSKHIGEIKDNDQVRATLSITRIVECEDGEFRQPGRAYFREKEVEKTLGNWANYALVPDRSESRRDLYRWLGVALLPRIADMLRLVDRATEAKPTPQAKSIVVKMLEALGLRWEELDDSDKSGLRRLTTKPWLPAEADANSWYKPNDLFAAYNRNLFSSQGRFLDTPLGIQRKIGTLLEWLGVNLSPRSSQVVRHLLTCSEINAEPPGNIYRWLNDNAQPNDLQALKGMPCLWVPETNEYLRPDQVFWGSHPFGEYRVQLGSGLREYQKLLEGLGVREKPGFNDAIEVLKGVSKKAGSGALEAEDENVVMQCWMMLSDALEKEQLDADTVEFELRDVPCVPTKQRRLHPPSWMFFEDWPGLADKFPGTLDQNCIPRTERVWTAMEAAGVSPISEVVRGYVAERVNPREDNSVLARVSGRVDLIRTILAGPAIAAQEEDRIPILNNIRFIQVDKLTVEWRLRALKQKRDAPPEPASAHWDSEEQLIFFANHDDGAYPWSHIARELTRALVPDVNPASISPGFKSVLEARTTREAEAQLSVLGIASIHTFDRPQVEGSVAESLGGDMSEMNDQSQVSDFIPNIPGDSRMPIGNGDSEDWFARNLYGVQTTMPSAAPDNPILLPADGPNTSQSASDYTNRSIRVGRNEPNELRLVTRSERGPEGRALEDEFRSMVQGDYGRRCQICSRTFTTTGGGWLVNVVHVVPPRRGYQTNHFGDLLGLCGWHYNLLRHGEWALLDPNNNQPFEDMDGTRGWERMRAFILNRDQEMDEWGNLYVGLPIQFSNVYQGWQPEPILKEEEIRYSIPHWEFLRRLLSQ